MPDAPMLAQIWSWCNSGASEDDVQTIWKVLHASIISIDCIMLPNSIFQGHVIWQPWWKFQTSSINLKLCICQAEALEHVLVQSVSLKLMYALFALAILSWFQHHFWHSVRVANSFLARSCMAPSGWNLGLKQRIACWTCCQKLGLIESIQPTWEAENYF